jgi:hypothetical protein
MSPTDTFVGLVQHVRGEEGQAPETDQGRSALEEHAVPEGMEFMDGHALDTEVSEGHNVPYHPHPPSLTRTDHFTSPSGATRVFSPKPWAV